ncbi:MAG TPA: DUF86 domain-containing protein [Balneolaceae bacterium]|nr:DUF86 domain-containing protein [Balneolaceae bacterium]
MIEEKIDSLQRCIKRIEAKRPETVGELKLNLDLQDILSVNLERAVQLCVDIGTHIIAESETVMPDTMAETFAILQKQNLLSKETAERMKKSVGFRNIAVHSYQKINWEIVFNICHKNLDDFKSFIRELNKLL